MLFEAKNIRFGVPGENQAMVIRNVVEAANELGVIADVSKTVAAVQHRETESTTGFGKGVAIPHGKTDGVKEPTVMFARLANKVEWNSLDGEPVDMLFMILVPEDSHNEHLQILAKLARRLMHEEFVAELRSRSDAYSVSAYLQEQLA